MHSRSCRTTSFRQIPDSVGVGVRGCCCCFSVVVVAYGECNLQMLYFPRSDTHLDRSIVVNVLSPLTDIRSVTKKLSSSFSFFYCCSGDSRGTLSKLQQHRRIVVGRRPVVCRSILGRHHPKQELHPTT